MNPLVFTAWIVLASWQMGVPVVPVVVDDRDSAMSWASMYVYEDGSPAYYVATPELLVYGTLEPEYLRLVAYHEVCHNLEGVESEDQANECTAREAGVTRGDIFRADNDAHAWCAEYCPEGEP